MTDNNKLDTILEQLDKLNDRFDDVNDIINEMQDKLDNISKRIDEFNKIYIQETVGCRYCGARGVYLDSQRVCNQC